MTARKIEDNLEMYWCLSRNDKKVTDFRQKTQCVEDAGLYLVLVSSATGVHGCRRECGATDLCWRGGAEGGGSGHSYSQPKILTLSHIVSPLGLRFFYLMNFFTQSDPCVQNSCTRDRFCELSAARGLPSPSSAPRRTAPYGVSWGAVRRPAPGFQAQQPGFHAISWCAK